jgi:PilZ domain
MTAEVTLTQLPVRLEGPDKGRRLHIRYACDFLTKCPDAPQTTAFVTDISRTGIGLLVNQALDQEAVVALELPLAGGAVEACVEHVTATSDGWWTIGCSFTRELSPESLESFSHPVPDRRQRPRFPCDLHACYRSADDDSERCTPVTDVSAQGLCLLAHEPLTAGKSLELELGVPGEPPLLSIFASVARVHRQGSKWACGCTFAQELTDDQLLELVPFVVDSPA